MEKNKEYERTNEFRELQEESRRLSTSIDQQDRVSSFNRTLWGWVEKFLQRKTKNFYSRNSIAARILKILTISQYKVVTDKTPLCFWNSKTYLPKGKLVVLNDDCTYIYISI